MSKHGKLKDYLDPLNAVRKYLGTEGIERVIRLSGENKFLNREILKSFQDNVQIRSILSISYTGCLILKRAKGQ